MAVIRIYSCGAAADFHRFPFFCLSFLYFLIYYTEINLNCLHFIAQKMDNIAFLFLNNLEHVMNQLSFFI